ncbi:hypothetical protein, partial [Micromonospora sp. NPDC051296]|uniref:hypothetical protein n=1 Tax=Micromonospora sp. NPDC051296 TaxID=3155046 RepID=UPI003438FCCB
MRNQFPDSIIYCQPSKLRAFLCFSEDCGIRRAIHPTAVGSNGSMRKRFTRLMPMRYATTSAPDVGIPIVDVRHCAFNPCSISVEPANLNEGAAAGPPTVRNGALTERFDLVCMGLAAFGPPSARPAEPTTRGYRHYL